ncbi:hypothetical protein MC28_1512 [Bacillus thuringiensis MC28]|nr:hypothetical protein MC28_1512 [Bacillus thuringiensis MC28]
MAVITLNELFDVVSRERYSNRTSHQAAVLIETLNESGVVKIIDENYILYPKNLFREDKDVELFFFKKKEIIVCKINADGDVSVQNFLSKNVDKFEMNKLNADKQTVELSIHITNEEPIHLSNKGDTNQYWSRKFYTLILDIYNNFK